MIELVVLLGIALAAFIMETIDSGIGMMYGTLLSPVLILAGFDPLMVVPSLLLSQAIGGFAATYHHNKYKNAEFKRKTLDLKITGTIIGLGIFALTLGVLVGSSIPSLWLKAYIGLLCTFMGGLVLSKWKFKFSFKKITALGFISSFNKSVSGGGFGPIIATGQIASGVEEKKSIGITDFAEAPICIFSFIAWCIITGIPDMSIMAPLCLGAGVGGLLGPYLLSKTNNKKAIRIAVGVLAIVSGVLTLLKTFGILKIG